MARALDEFNPLWLLIYLLLFLGPVVLLWAIGIGLAIFAEQLYFRKAATKIATQLVERISKH